MRGRRLVYIVLLTLLVPLGIAARTRPAKAPLQHEGVVFVYLEPFSSDAVRLDFRFERIFAVREDGTEVPLTRSFEDARNDVQPAQERLLATASLPPGQYAGLAIRVSAPTLEGAEGPVELTPPTGPARVDAPFRIQKRQAVVLKLRFQFKDSVGEGYAFTPVFTAHLAERPAVGRLALASNRTDNSVTLFDKVSAEIVGVIPTGLGPAGIALDQIRRRAYVAVSGEDTVIAIGLLEYAVIDRTTLRGGDVPVELALTPDGETLLSVNLASNTVSFIDTSSLTETERVKVGDEPRSVVVGRAGLRAYVLNSASSSISVLDLKNRRLAGTISTEAGPFRGQFNQAGDVLYVIHRLSSRISVIDPVARRVTSKVYVGPGATALMVDPRSDLVYLSRSGTGEVEIFDPRAFLPVDSFPVAGDVSFLALDLQQNYLYAVLPDLRQVQVVEVVGNKPRGRAETGDGPYWVVINGEK